MSQAKEYTLFKETFHFNNFSVTQYVNCIWRQLKICSFKICNSLWHSLEFKLQKNKNNF